MPVARSGPQLVKHPPQRWVLSKSIPKFSLQAIVRYGSEIVRRFVGGFAFFPGVFSIGVLSIPFGKGKTEKDEAILFYTRK
jgi:hypothetical protein